VPIFFQHQLDENTRLGIWKIEETEDFFRSNVPLHRDVTHPHKRLQHLAGRFLLQFLFPDFPYDLVQIADTRKPFLPDEQYHFSISHCGDYAAAIVSRTSRVGIDIEITVDKIQKLMDKFLSVEDQLLLTSINASQLTLLWSAKESIFKWYGEGNVDFRRHIKIQQIHQDRIETWFEKTNQQLIINYTQFTPVTLAWIATP
jgi:phosphopantetheinyl transferase